MLTPEPTNGYKVLVVDDNVGILFALKQSLQLKGYEVIVSETYAGVLAVHAIAPHLIFLDISLVGVDGRDVSKELKASERTKHIPIVILTAYPNAGDLAIEAGANGYLAKPFEINDLWEIAERFTMQPIDATPRETALI